VKIAVVGGAGRVGATTLFQLVLEGVAQELAVVDVVTDRAEGEMLDLLHGTNLSQRVKFSGPGYEACAGADGPIVEIRLDCGGEALIARLTRRSVETLGLAPGRPVYAVIKSIAFDHQAFAGTAPPSPGADAETRDG